MKKLMTVFLITIMLLTMSIPVLAIAPEYTYDAQELVIPVTFTAKKDADEWADAVKLVINADNEVFKEYGRFQTEPRVATINELSVTYYIKWDKDYLYIREERLDTDGLNNPTVDPSGPWMGDGTAFFFADGNDLTRADVRWIPYTDTNSKNCAVYSQVLDKEVTDEWQCQGAKYGDVYIIEVAMPWSVMGDKLTQEIKEGATFRFCPIITSRDSDDMYGDWTTEVQINFYDGYNKYNLENSESPEYHAGIKLTAANYEYPVEVETADEPAPTDTTKTTSTPVTSTSPQTSDNTLIVSMIIFAITLSVGIGLMKKKKYI